MLFYLLRPLLHRMSAEKFSNVGFKLGSNQANNAFAHARDGAIRILVEHFIPMLFHKGPRLCSRVLIEENAAHEIGRVLRAHFAANGHLQRSVDQVRLAEGSESEKITCLFLWGLSVLKPGVELVIIRAAPRMSDNRYQSRNELRSTEIGSFSY